MAVLKTEPARFDVALADAVSAHTASLPENVALTWGADAHVLGAAPSAAGYFCGPHCRRPKE